MYQTLIAEPYYWCL